MYQTQAGIVGSNAQYSRMAVSSVHYAFIIFSFLFYFLQKLAILNGRCEYVGIGGFLCASREAGRGVCVI